MRLPYVSGSERSAGIASSFGGLNTNENAGENEFSHMKNLSGRAYPYIATRRARTKLREGISPDGLVGAAEDLILIDSGKVYRGEELLAEVSPGEKQTALLGACLVIWPDKVEINLKTGGVRALENAISIAGEVSVAQASLTGEESETAVFIKIAASGIGKGFSAWDGILLSGFSEESLNGAHILYAVQEDFLIVPGVLPSGGFSQTGGIAAKRTCPDLDFIAVQGNRLWGCSSENHEIYASKLGDAANWNAFAGTAADSYAATAAAAGDFTGAAAVNDTIVFFQEDGFYKVLGTKPANFQITYTPASGVMKGCERSLCMLDGSLYYMGRGGIYTYDGALPVRISRALDGWRLKNGAAGAAGGIYRISCEDEKGNAHMLVFDANTGLWHREDDMRAARFAAAGGKMYFAAEDALWLADAGSEKIDWECVTGRMSPEMPGHKYLSRIVVQCEAEKGARIALAVRYDDKGPWEESVFYNKRTIVLNLRERRANFARIRLRGTGECRIYSVTRGIMTGSEIRPWSRI